jgi:putative endonuclease
MDIRRRFGDQGETFVCTYLTKNRYIILERNYRTRFGEIDIIAQIDDTICFIEVKTRAHYHAGMGEIVTPSKQRKIIQTAKHFLMNNVSTSYIARFDVAFLVGDEPSKLTLSYIPNAFYEEL